jgi:hypothetical protein
MPLDVLQTAHDMIHGPRAEAYGDATTNFTRWRDMCRATGRLGLAAITAEDLAVVMVCLKVCRDTNKAADDNLVDGAAYFDLWNQVRGL